MSNEIELLVVGNCMLHKSEQNPRSTSTYKDEFEPINLKTKQLIEI